MSFVGNAAALPLRDSGRPARAQRTASSTRRGRPRRHRQRHPGHDASPLTVRGALSAAHWIVQTESSLHDSEHESVQRTVHVEPLAHVTLPLLPTVRSQSEPPAQLALQDSPHSPAHSLSFVQLNVQLEPEQLEPSSSHEVPAGHAHDVPVQSGGGGPPSPPQATNAQRNNEQTRPGLDMQSPYHRLRCVCDVHCLHRAPGHTAYRQCRRPAPTITDLVDGARAVL
jgi:hypothetical protein